MTTRAWGKFKPMMAAPVWVRMDTITRASHGSGSSTIRLHLIDGEHIDVAPAFVAGTAATYCTAAEALLKVLLRDLTATKPRALTDYTGAIK